MYVDKGLLIDPALDLDGAGTDYYGRNCVDLALAARDVGKGRQMYVVIVVTEAFVSTSTASVITFSLVEDALDGIDGNSIIVLSTEGFTAASLTRGRAAIIIPIPPIAIMRSRPILQAYCVLPEY
ncbi:unnamed protein product [marine sediment metagenome]|uniref:Uncharacterized protein n=1 Tax=marine sediment metagenome TaxID=412755 RepID=X1HIT6_9ZZZZ